MFEFLNSSLQNFTRSFRSKTNAQLLLFFTSLSPLFIGTILFFYMGSELGVPLDEILRVSALYAMMPLLLDVPMGMLADRYGVKKTLYGGLGSYVLSILAILFLPTPWSYHLYFFFSKIGVPCISGADFSLIRQQVPENQAGGFKNTIYFLQKWTYLINAIINLITPFVYNYNKKLPFVLQALLLVLSMINLATMQETRGKIRLKRKRLVNDFVLCIRLCVFNRRYLLLLVCSAVFGLGVTLNNTVIQHQLTSHLSLDFVYGLVFAASGIFSAFGTTALARGLRELDFTHQILILLAMDAFAFFAMGTDHILAIIAGFLMINLFKGGFRPLVNAELTNQMPFHRLTAQALSFASFASALFANALQWALAGQYKEGSKGHIYYALIASICVLSALAYSALQYRWTVFERKSRQRNKKSQLICKNGDFLLLQLYPLEEEKLFDDMKTASMEQIYPTPRLNIRSTMRNFEVEMPFLGDVKLGDLRDAGRQFAMCRDFLIARREKNLFLRQGEFPSAVAVFSPKLSKYLLLPPDESRLAEIDLHGCLDPTNLMIRGNQMFAINWSRCGKGPWWWDLLTLLTHPYLYFSVQWRVQLMAQFAPWIELESGRALFFKFIEFQIDQLKLKRGVKDQELARRYAKLLN